MTARRNREPNSIECFRNTFREIQKCVVRWIKFVATGKSALHGDGNPVAELHFLLFQISRHLVSPTWQVVNENSSARLQETDRFCDPQSAPIEIVIFRKKIRFTVVVLLAQIERGSAKMQSM